LLPGCDVVPQAAWQTRISGIELGQSIYDQIRLFCTGFLTVGRQHADRLCASFDSVLSKQIDDLEPTLTRHGHTAKVLTEMLGTKPGEIKALFKQTLEVDRARELKEQMLAAGLPL
jgi:hypothetical protein